MKKRLLSLLVAMAMIVSMVPFQALAEEPDETPALLETAEGIAPEDETTEVTIPETTEETVPETTEETVPETTEETVPETTEETVPETTEEIIPETTEETVPETTEETVPEVTEALIPEEAAVIPEGSDNLAPEGEEEEEPSFNITFPSSARKIFDGFPVLTAGQKLNLSTSLSKADAKKGIEWMVVYGKALDTGEPVSALSLDEIRPEGAAVDGAQWDSIASISEKGVLRTNAAVTAESYLILVKAISKDKDVGFGLLPVLIQPPVESFRVNVSWGLEAAPAPDEESAEGAVNRKDNEPWNREIGNGPFELYADSFQPQIPADGVKWSIKVSKNVADWKETEDNTIIVTPKAPGKLTFTATAKDGSGAKYSGIVEIYGYHRDVEITSWPKTMTAGDKPVAIAAKAYYDDNQDFPIAKPTIWWDLMEAVEVDEDEATDDWGYLIDGYYYDGENYYEGYYTDAATIKGGKLTLGRITKNTKLLLVASCPGRPVYDSDSENWISSNVKDYVFIDVKPANEKTLALAYDRDGYYYPVDTSWYDWGEVGETAGIQPVWMDNDGNVLTEELPTDFTFKISGKACSYDKDTGTLHYNKIGTSKLTVTCEGQSVTGEFRCVKPCTSVTINGKDEKNTITVVGGKSLSLKATNWYDSKTKATNQSVYWEIDGKAFSDEYEKSVYNFCWIGGSTGKLTTYPVREDYYVTVTANSNYESVSSEEEGWPADTVRIHIIPEKTQYRSQVYIDTLKNGCVYLTGKDQWWTLGDDFRCNVKSYGRYAEFRPTDIISSNPKIATVVKDDSGIGIKIPADAKPGKVTITFTGQVLAGATWVDEYYDDESGQYVEGYWEGGEWINAPSAKFTFKTVKPVTDIKLSRPTNKDGSFVPAYVGKSLKLTAKVNSDATNKKLNWGVCYYNGDPEGEFDWKLDGDNLEELDWNDKTTVKNGVLKIDKSWYSHGRCYAVFAFSQDGNAMSDPIFIQAYGMTGTIEIWSAGEFNVNKDGYELLDKINNHTITIMPGEEVEFAALVYDVTGNIIDCYQEDVKDEVTGEIIDTVLVWNNHGANPDVKWTISGNKGYVDFEDTFEGGYDTMSVVGLKPGTVTVKVSANDGSKKTATFKLVVEPSAPK